MDFCNRIPQIVADEVGENARREAKLINDLRAAPEFQDLVVRDVKQDLERAEHLLVNGDIVGVDGTMSKYHLLSGIRCQIGVVAVNYQGDQIKHSFFISQASLREEADGVLERIFQRSDANGSLSDMHLRGIMMYRERDAGMDARFGGKYVMYHGPLLPFELMSGLGRLRALGVTLELLRRVVRSKKTMSIISTTTHKDLTYFGLAIDAGQYVTHPNWNLEYHLSTTSDFLTQRSKWREDEIDMVERFVKDYGSQIQIGVLRVGDRPYVFQAHKDIFDLAAAIISRDAMFQREKGFPLLIDYADSLCSQYFSQSQFSNMMEWHLAKTNTYLRESGERRMRLK